MFAEGEGILCKVGAAKFNDRGAVVHCYGEHDVELLRTTVGQPEQMMKLVSRTHNDENVVEAVRPTA